MSAGAVAVVAIVVLCGLLARQRQHAALGGRDPGRRSRAFGVRWQYGIARYVGVELRWYRALGLGTRPTRVLRQGEVRLVLERVSREPS